MDTEGKATLWFILKHVSKIEWNSQMSPMFGSNMSNFDVFREKKKKKNGRPSGTGESRQEKVRTLFKILNGENKWALFSRNVQPSIAHLPVCFFQEYPQKYLFPDRPPFGVFFDD